MTQPNGGILTTFPKNIFVKYLVMIKIKEYTYFFTSFYTLLGSTIQKNIFHVSNTWNFEGNFLRYWIEIFGHWKIVFGSIASYFYYFPLSVSYRYGNLYRPIPITIPIRHFPYRQNRYICRYRYIGRYRYRNCIGRTLSISVHPGHVWDFHTTKILFTIVRCWNATLDIDIFEKCKVD